MTKYEIRKAKPEDIPSLLLLLNKLGYQINHKDFEKNFENCMALDMYHSLVFEECNIIKAMVIFVIYPKFHKISNHFFLELIIVNEKYRNQGIGSKMLKECELYAQENNCSSISLISNVKREKATKKFYYNNGYNNEGQKAQLYLRKEISIMISSTGIKK